MIKSRSTCHCLPTLLSGSHTLPTLVWSGGSLECGMLSRLYTFVRDVCSSSLGERYQFWSPIFHRAECQARQRAMQKKGNNKRRESPTQTQTSNASPSAGILEIAGQVVGPAQFGWMVAVRHSLLRVGTARRKTVQRRVARLF